MLITYDLIIFLHCSVNKFEELHYIVILWKFEQNLLHQTWQNIWKFYGGLFWPARESGLWKAPSKRRF